MIPSKQLQNKVNISRILQLLWKKPRSRTEIAKKLDLDKSTITDAIEKLKELDLVTEWKVGSSTPGGGRKPIFLKLREDFGVSVGIEFRLENYRVSICDIHGKPIRHYTKNHSIEPSNLSSYLHDAISELLEDLETQNLKVIGIGVGLSGIIDTNQGSILHSIPLHISQEVQIAPQLMEHHSIPILLENDANACAWAELGTPGITQQDSEFLSSDPHEESASLPNSFIAVLGEMPQNPDDQLYGFSAGLGLCLNQRIYHGKHYYAGEFRSLFWKGEKDGQFSLPKQNLPEVHKSIEVRATLFHEFASQIALFTNTLDCESIYICGDLERYAHEFNPILEHHIRTNWSYEHQKPKSISLQISSFGENAVSVGAAAMVLHHFFSVPDYGTDSGSQNAQFREILLSYLQ